MTWPPTAATSNAPFDSVAEMLVLLSCSPLSGTENASRGITQVKFRFTDWSALQQLRSSAGDETEVGNVLRALMIH